jgi:NhaP-type Na+/H+ or K+/H+ antiporter
MEESFAIIVSVLLGLLGVPFVSWVKGKLNVSEGKALLIAGAVAGVLGAAQLFVAGQLGVADFSLDNLAATFGVIFSSATVFYKLLKYGKQE